MFLEYQLSLKYSTATTTKRKAIEDFATEIVRAAEEIDDDNTLDRVLTQLSQTHAAMTAATTTKPATIKNFEKKEHFFPAQKNETQLRFKQTIAKPGRKKQTVPLRYNNKFIVACVKVQNYLFRLPSKEQQKTWWADMETEIPM